jgi:PEP-CTERM motif
VAKIVFDGTNGTPNLTGGGIEQPVWDPNSGKFYLNIDPTTGPGGTLQIDETGRVTHFYDLASFGISSCGPAGLAVGKNSRLGIDCGAVGSSSVLSPGLFLDALANGGQGAIVASFNQLGGGDEAWYDPTTGYFFLTGYRNTAQTPGLLVIDGNTAVPSLVEFVPTSVGSHSVAVDPVSGEVFVPAGGAVAGSVCPNGCILVFANVAAVPEPGSLTLIMTAFAGLAGLIWHRRRQS